MLYPYQLGVAEYLDQTFDCSTLRCAGHSAGFAAALSLAAGVPASTHWRVLQAAQARWHSRALGFCLDSESAWMQPYILALAGEEAAVLRAAREGRLSLGHTRLRLRSAWPPLAAGHCVTVGFSSLSDFVHCVTVSQRCPPFYRAPGWRASAWGLDGAFSAAFTVPPGAPASRVVTVSPTDCCATISPSPPLPRHWFFQLPDTERWAALKLRGFEDALAKREALLAAGLVLKEAVAM